PGRGGAGLGAAGRRAPAGGPSPPAAADRWNDWVMRLAGDGAWNGQRAFRTLNVSGSASAARVVESSKRSLSGYYNYGEQRFDSPRFLGVQRGWGGGARAGWSPGAPWAGGGRGPPSAAPV